MRTRGAGLLSKIFSILSRISGVNLGTTSKALRFSRTCLGDEAPRMTVLVLGFRMSQARARAPTVQESSTSGFAGEERCTVR